MRHLYEYEDEEIKTMMTDLEGVGHGQLKGWIVYGIPFNSGDAEERGVYYSITAENIKQAVYYFLLEVLHGESDELEALFRFSQPETFREAEEALSEHFENEEGVSIELVWEGLIPKKSNPSSDSYFSANVLLCLENLKENFSNVEFVLKANPSGIDI